MRILCFCLLFFSPLKADAIRSTPWLTEKANAFLEKFFTDNPDAHVLEFGSGASTVWIAKRVRHLISIEHNRKWYLKICGELKVRGLRKRVDYRLCQLPYYEQCDTIAPESLDLVIVDGRNRKGCIANSIPLLKPGGVLMLDNAERPYYHAVFPLLDEWEMVITEQEKPDREGFTYPGWTTQWWIKPIL